MTAGSKHYGSSAMQSSAIQPSTIQPRDDRETLSALFDGELPDDATRFALKRLAHDAGWREACGRWQLIGDALRKEAIAMAPADFASEVMRALNAGDETGASGAPVGVPSRPVHASSMRRRWMGGAALAASVAMAAVLGVRPLLRPATSAPDAQATSAAVPPIAPATAMASSKPEHDDPPEAPVRAAEVRRPAADRLAGSGPRAVRPGNSSAQVELARTSGSRPIGSRPIGSRRIGSRRIQSAQSEAALIASAPGESPASAASAAVAAPTPSEAASQPFQADVAIVRPWPRAVLPDTVGSGALTVGFGDSAHGTDRRTDQRTERSPSFYPFEPHLPASGMPAADEKPRGR